ncbi:hypothetical protein WMY93_009575 [Mugilogobius chulae]|uniref:polynucleotide adenylyltransferase n=1 Tax=Mugilogobius chulae TaxID=88201 RepID=A0AAW0PF90_9GOBI
MELQTEKRFQNLTLEQIQALDKVLTEVIPIYGRGNFPTLQVRAKDIIRVVKERLVERDIHVKDVRLNGATASHVLVRNNGLGYKDLDIIFGVDLPRQEDFQVIKEVVLGSLRDLLPCGVNRRKITCLTMKEAYVQKMVKVFNEHDKWSLISLSNNRAKTVGLRFVSSLRRHFEFSVDSFQIILDRMLESYWESERRQSGKMLASVKNISKCVDESKEQEKYSVPKVELGQREEAKIISSGDNSSKRQTKTATDNTEKEEEQKEQILVPEISDTHSSSPSEEVADKRGGKSEENIVFELCNENIEDKCQFHKNYPLTTSSKSPFAEDVQVTNSCLKLQSNKDPCESETAAKESDHKEDISKFKVNPVLHSSVSNNLSLEYSFPPPAKKSCSNSLEIVPPDTCPSPKLQRKMSRKLITKQQLSEKWSLLPDLSDLTTQLFPPIEMPKPLQHTPALMDNVQNSTIETSEGSDKSVVPVVTKDNIIHEGSATSDLSVKPKQLKKPPDLGACVIDTPLCTTSQISEPPETALGTSSLGSSLWTASSGETNITVEAECMYGDFQQALHHLQNRLIATHNPEEIRGGGLLKYSDLLVRNFRPASDTEIKSLERYMCSRFFIDFPDVAEQQRKIEAYLQCHYIGSDEASKYDYLMTLRRVIDESTVCLMGHERRQTLNMITVFALRVLGEQNAIPNTANVTCFYQPAPYMTEPMYNSYFISQTQPPLVYHPYPLQVHLQSGLV